MLNFYSQKVPFLGIFINHFKIKDTEYIDTMVLTTLHSLFQKQTVGLLITHFPNYHTKWIMLITPMLTSVYSNWKTNTKDHLIVYQNNVHMYIACIIQSIAILIYSMIAWRLSTQSRWLVPDYQLLSTTITHIPQ